MLLARAEQRRAEIGVRLALGASRARLTRQLLTESILLSLVGGGLGIVVACWGADLLFAFLPQNYTPIAIDIRPDLRALAFTLSISIATGVSFGLAPIIHAARTDLVPALKNAGSSVGFAGARFPLRRVLVVVQVAVSLVLLVVSGLLVRSLDNLKRVNIGMRYENTLLFTMKPVQERYTLDQLRNFCVAIIEQVKALPGVQSASLSEGPPFSARVGSATVGVVGQPRSALREAIDDRVMPGFFETLGIPLLAGRDFAASDRGESHRVAIINDILQRDLFANRSPLGERIVLGSSKDEFEIIGVVQGVKYENVRESPQPGVYMSILQEGSPGMPTLLVHTRSNASSVVAAVRHEFDVLDKELPVFNVKPMSRAIDESLAEERLIAALSGLFGITALLLASFGLYGVVAHTVTRRTREIGLRMALGADRTAVQLMVMGDVIGMV
jgi:predicted permease